MGNVFTSYSSTDVDANGNQRASWGVGGVPYQRVKYTTAGFASTTVVDVMRGETHWEGTSSVRPLHLGGPLASVTPIHEPRLRTKLEAAPTLDDKIEVLRNTPVWMQTNDLDISQLSSHHPTTLQRASLRQVLSNDHYQRLAVAYLESSPDAPSAGNAGAAAAADAQA